MVSVRVLSVVALVAGIFGVAHAPFHSAAYLATEEGASGESLLPWAGRFRDTFPAAFGFADAWGVYRAIGAAEPFVLAGMAAGVWILHRLRAEGESRFGLYAWRGLFATQVLFAAATAVEYYTPFRDAAFLVAFPALFAGLLGFVVYGVATLRAKVLPRDVSWSLIGGAVAFVPLAATFGHIAMAMTALLIALVRIGIVGLRSGTTPGGSARTTGAEAGPRSPG